MLCLRRCTLLTRSRVFSAAQMSGAGAGTGDKKAKSGGFQSMGLSANILGGIMKMGYKVPTPIQRKALPLALSGRDLVAMARTGASRLVVHVWSPAPTLILLAMYFHAISLRMVCMAQAPAKLPPSWSPSWSA